MANIRKHPKTGIFWYRRVVPVRLRQAMPNVEGFAAKANRTEFIKTLGTRSKAEANRLAAELDVLVQRAFDAAEQNLTGTASASPPVAAKAPDRPDTAPVVLDPRRAFTALMRWETQETRAIEQRAFNEPVEVGIGARELEEGALLLALQARPMRQRKGWLRVPDFDEQLVAALRSQGIEAAVGHPALERMRDDFAERWESLILLKRRVRMGLWAPDDEQPPNSAAEPTTALSVQQVLDDYLRECRASGSMRPDSEADARYAFRRFMEFCESPVDAAKVTPDLMRRFRDAALELPSRPKRRDASLPMKQLLDAYRLKPEAGRLNRKTVSKWLDFLHAGFAHAVTTEKLLRNPVTPARFRKQKGPQPRARIEFTNDDLKTIFASPLFQGCADPRNLHKPGDLIVWGARYWIMLIGAVTGARLDEIGQLAVTDVVRYDDILTIKITVDPADGDEQARQLKTESSIRAIPLHPRLSELGFPDYVEKRRAEGSTYLFPDLDHHGKAEPTRALSQWYGRYFDRIGIVDRRKVFHSFRHWIKTAFRQHKINRDVSDYITGHAAQDVSGQYGGAPHIAELHATICLLDVSFLDGVKRPASPSLVAAPSRNSVVARRRRESDRAVAPNPGD